MECIPKIVLSRLGQLWEIRLTFKQWNLLLHEADLLIEKAKEEKAQTKAIKQRDKEIKKTLKLPFSSRNVDTKKEKK